METKIDDFSAAHNELVDAHVDVKDEPKALRLKVAKLEDRSRRNNVKFRGSLKPADLRSSLQQLMTKALPSLQPADIIIDRAHRLHKPPHLPKKVPRDVIARIHYVHVKYQLIRISRENNALQNPYEGITLYADLSRSTMAARNNLIPITKMLRNL